MEASEIRLKARETLKGNYWNAVLVAIVAAIFGALVINGGSFSINIEDRVTEVFGSLPRIIKIYLGIAAGFASVTFWVSFILGGVVQLGYARYLLKQHDGEVCSVKELF